MTIFTVALVTLAPYFMTSQALHISLTDKERAIALLRPLHDDSEREARSLIDSLQRLEQIRKDDDLSRAQTVRMGIKGLVGDSSVELPVGVLIPINGTDISVPSVPVTLHWTFSSKAGEKITETKIMFVYVKLRDGWHLADIEVLRLYRPLRMVSEQPGHAPLQAKAAPRAAAEPETFSQEHRHGRRI